MSDVKQAASVGAGIRKSTGSLPGAKFKKSKKEEVKKKADRSKPYSNLGKGRREQVIPDQGEVVSPAGHIGQGEEIIDAEWWPTPKEIGGSRKALPKPPTKAIEAPGTGPFVATPHVDLTPGPNFGGTVHEITKAKKPRQFEGY